MDAATTCDRNQLEIPGDGGAGRPAVWSLGTHTALMVLVLPLDPSLISSVLTISHNAILASLISLYIHSPFLL